MLASNCRSAIATLVERQSRYTMLVLLGNHFAARRRERRLGAVQRALRSSRPVGLVVP